MSSGPAVTTELIPFEHITLKRGSGYLVDGYIYTRKRTHKDRTMFRCQERKCPAKGYIAGQHAVVTNPTHNHRPPDVRAIRFRAQLREAVGEERNITLTVPEVYNQVKCNFMQQATTVQQREELDAALPTRSSVERAMHRRRTEVMPQATAVQQSIRRQQRASTTTLTMQSYLGNLLQPTELKTTVRAWLKEDIPSFDYGGFVVGEKPEKAVLLGKSNGILAGVPYFNAIFEELGCTVQWSHPEGARLEPVCRLAVVKGKACHILQGERTALNCIARASGIASMAKNLDDLAKQFNWQGQIAGTRKTTPGFRMVEKYGLLVGGVSTHRYDLSSMIMLKDNHIWSAGSIKDAVNNAKSVGGFSTKIEVECRTKEDAVEAASAGADVVMLDNFQAVATHNLARELKSQFPRLLIEASGGITEDTVSTYFGPYIDVISMSRLTQGYGVVDFSLKIQKEGVDPSNPTVNS